MNAYRPNPLPRLVSATLAAGTTLAILVAVVSVSEPQRSTLMAKYQGQPMPAATLLAAAPVTAGRVLR